MVIDNPTDNLVLVDKYKAWMDGTVVKLNDNFSISHFIAKADFNYAQVNEYYKNLHHRGHYLYIHPISHLFL